MARRIVLVFLTVVSILAPRAGWAAQAPSRGVLLDVPYLAQTEQLCGGASVAMVLRYWGDPNVVPQDFSPLVERARGGIRTTRLTAAVVDRGWNAVAAAGTPSLAHLRQEVTNGRPVIALIEDRPDAFHYVVVVGFTADTIVFHDPARAPYRVMPAAEFDKRSQSAERWLLAIAPRGAASTSTRAPALQGAESPSPTATACARDVNSGVEHAQRGDLSAAERDLAGAITRCPTDASAWREFGGLRFVQKRYTDAGILVGRATELAPDDADAWQLLGSSEFMRDDLARALAAWNRVGRPAIDTIEVTGLARTRQPVAIGVTGLSSRRVLTPSAFSLAARRVDELPTAGATGLRYKPVGPEKVSIDLTIVERPILPTGAMGWATLGIASGFRRELRVDVASPTGSGELVTGAWRWAQNRPRVRFGLRVPPVSGLPAFVDADILWERQSYARGQDISDPLRQERRRAGVTLSNWATPWMRWEGGAGIDRVDSARYVSTNGRLIARLLHDRVALVGEGGRWFATSDDDSFSTRNATAWWRTSPRSGVAAITGRAGVAWTSSAAPLAVWPVAGASDGRGVFLRAHSLLTDGVITASTLGRTLTFATVEYGHPVYRGAYGALGLAAFLDVARAARRMADLPDGDTQYDLGGGLRVATPTFGGTVRIDVAYGIHDRATKFSAGYVVPWGR